MCFLVPATIVHCTDWTVCSLLNKLLRRKLSNRAACLETLDPEGQTKNHDIKSWAGEVVDRSLDQLKGGQSLAVPREADSAIVDMVKHRKGYEYFKTR